MNPAAILQWAVNIIHREQKEGTYGQVIIHLQAGKIIHVETKKTEQPPRG